MEAQTKRPQTARTVQSQETQPAKNQALSPKRTTSWRDWLYLEIDRGWLTDGGEYTTDWTVA